MFPGLVRQACGHWLEEPLGGRPSSSGQQQETDNAAWGRLAATLSAKKELFSRLDIGLPHASGWWDNIP